MIPEGGARLAIRTVCEGSDVAEIPTTIGRRSVERDWFTTRMANISAGSWSRCWSAHPHEEWHCLDAPILGAFASVIEFALQQGQRWVEAQGVVPLEARVDSGNINSVRNAATSLRAGTSLWYLRLRPGSISFAL